MPCFNGMVRQCQVKEFHMVEGSDRLWLELAWEQAASEWRWVQLVLGPIRGQV